MSTNRLFISNICTRRKAGVLDPCSRPPANSGRKTQLCEPALSLPGACRAFLLLAPLLVYKTGRTGVNRNLGYIEGLVLRDEKDRYNAGPEGRGFSPAAQWNRFHAGL